MTGLCGGLGSSGGHCLLPVVQSHLEMVRFGSNGGGCMLLVAQCGP